VNGGAARREGDDPGPDGVRTRMLEVSHSITIARIGRRYSTPSLTRAAGDRGMRWSVRWSKIPTRDSASERSGVARVGSVEVELLEDNRPHRAVHIARPWMADALHVWELEPP
jgi:hypothetical protein